MNGNKMRICQFFVVSKWEQAEPSLFIQKNRHTFNVLDFIHKIRYDEPMAIVT